MPKKLQDWEIPARIITEEEIEKIDRMCKEGVKRGVIWRELGFRLELSFDKSLSLTGYRLGRVLQPIKRKYIVQPNNRIDIQELERIQELLWDYGVSVRGIARVMYREFGNYGRYGTHRRLHFALKRTGYIIRLGLIPVERGAPIGAGGGGK